MRQGWLLLIAVLVGYAPSEAWSQLTAPPTHYRLVEIGTLGGKTCRGYALNNRGEVVGESEDSQGKQRAFLWMEGKMRALNLPPANSSLASDINDAGQVVCVVTVPGGKPVQVVLWANGKSRILLTQPKPNPGYTWALINNRGLIAGMTEAVTGSVRVFTWQNGKLTDIKVGASYRDIWARGMNDAGQILCSTNRIDAQGIVLNQPTCIIERGRFRLMENLGGDGSYAEGINNKGQSVGYVRDPYAPGSRDYPFLWEKGKVTTLNTPDYDTLWMPSSINNRGQIVGDGLLGSEPALLLWQEGKIYALNSLLPLKEGWKKEDRSVINERGEILVNLRRDKQVRAYLLIPTGP